MEITRDQVTGYITAVIEALKAAGHKLDDPFIDDQDDMVISIMIGIPDALTDEHERLGLALLWEPEDGWVMGFMSHRYGNTVRVTGHTDLRLGVVPAPDVIVRSVATIVADGDPKAGRIVPGPAELLARYSGGRVERCGCPPDTTDTLDDVTVTGHANTCHLGNTEGPRWYTWQGFDQPECLEAGTLADFARSWSLHRHTVHVAGTAIPPIEVRTWDRTYQAVITEQTVDAEALGGTYLLRVEEESVTEFVGLAEHAHTT